MKIIQVSLTEKQTEKVREESRVLGSSIASIMRKALMDYFKRQEGKQ